MGDEQKPGSGFDFSPVYQPAPVTAAAAPLPLALLTAGTAPPLTGTALWVAKLAAASCAIGCLAMIVWRRLPQPQIFMVAALGIATTCATPTLVALTWDQLFTAAHPWAVALAVAVSWSTAAGLLLFIPRVLFNLAFSSALHEPPLHEKYEDREARIAKLKQRMASPTRGPAPALPLAILGALWELAILAQPLPLAYPTWSAPDVASRPDVRTGTRLLSREEEE